MSFGHFRATGNKDDLVRELCDPSYTSRMLGQSITTVATAATYVYALGLVEREGLWISSFHVYPSAAVARSASNYFTFKPFWSTVVNAVAQKRYLGTARGTNTVSLVADVPFRMHEEEELNLAVPKGAVLGVDLVVTLTPAATRLSLLANLKYGG